MLNTWGKDQYTTNLQDVLYSHHIKYQLPINDLYDNQPICLVGGHSAPLLKAEQGNRGSLVLMKGDLAVA